ncbi:MAG TPA: isochorismatase family protein, partial [Anaeromyxobacteraceae bacterium]|nr:isochorismatase family protein [Anaeromyxobacteraceae bacterium]
LWPDHCVQGTQGAMLHPGLPDRVVTLVLRKGTRREVDSYSAFREEAGPDGRRPVTGLAAWLRARGVGRVFICGLARDFCVRLSAIDAVAAGFETYVLDDLTRAVFPAGRVEVDSAFAAAGVKVIEARELVL